MMVKIDKKFGILGVFSILTFYRLEYLYLIEKLWILTGVTTNLINHSNFIVFLLFFFSEEMKISRRSRPEVFFKKGVHRNFAKFTGKHMCQSLLLNKVAGLRHATLLKKRLWRRCFSVNFAKCLRTLFYIEHLWWLILDICITFRSHITFKILN